MIVVGAGPAGLCVAGELCRAGVEVRLLEQRRQPAAGTRAIGVHVPVLRALEPSGVTEQLLEEGVRITGGIARSGTRELGRLGLARPGQRFGFALAVPQAVTEAALTAAAPPIEHATQVVRISQHASGVEVDIRDPDGDRTLRAQALVLASGAAGRHLAPTAARPVEYGDRYVMADIDGVDGDEHTAVITLSRAGVVESFPLPGRRRRLVAWCGRGVHITPGSQAGVLRTAITERASLAHLADRVESAHSFGIRSALLPRMSTGSVSIIGDAAHEVSPIGGQGMNLGLLDAVSLAPALAAWLRTGDAAALKTWERRRLTSARRAARLAGMNTLLGRPRTPAAHRALATDRKSVV